jgi:aryl-alcohol dehydrogenase-like predicted oxidoreductase
MEYRRLGNSGLKVSTLCLGAMMFGDRTSEDVAARIVDHVLKSETRATGLKKPAG